MKYCPVCRKTYTNEMNFCLNDGVTLELMNLPSSGSLSEETVRFEKAGMSTHPNRNKPTNPFPASPPKKSSAGKILLIIAGVGLVFLTVAAVGFFYLVRNINQKKDTIVYETPRPSLPIYSPAPEKPEAKPKIEVKILDKVKDNFGDNYLKCLVTNTGESIIIDPSFSLDLYDNDVKVGSLYGRTNFKYLKPQQTIPVWINLFAEKKFTSARFNEAGFLRTTDKEPEKLFPTLVFTDAKMTIETGTSSYNGRLYQDKIFVVSGIVENQLYENISPEIFILYFDANDEIVGINSTYPSAMKKGEKSKFESSIGKTSSYGTPVRFEIIAVDDD